MYIHVYMCVYVCIHRHIYTCTIVLCIHIRNNKISFRQDTI